MEAITPVLSWRLALGYAPVSRHRRSSGFRQWIMPGLGLAAIA